MKRTINWSSDVCAEKFLEALDRQKRQMAEIASHSRANDNVRNACQGFYAAFEAVQEAVENDEQVRLIVGTQSRLPNFGDTDEEYGEVPF